MRMKEYFISAKNRYTKSENKYLKNGAVLKSEKDEDIDEETFKDMIIREVSKFTHQTYDNVIALVGAGGSVVCTDDGINRKYGKTVFMLAELIDEKLEKDNNCYSLQELSDLCRYTIPTKITGTKGKTEFNPSFQLEDFLSNLLAFEKYVLEEEREKYESSKNIILELIISNTDYNYDNSCMKHSAFINTLSHLVRSPSKLTMVTTNYDTLIEDAANSIKYTVIDGFTFSHRPHFDSDMFEWNLVRDIENIKTREIEYKKNIVNLLKLHGSLTWEYSGGEIFRKDKQEVKEPIMIFPSSNKYMQSYQEPYFELFAKFQELLKRPNTLLITVGFSFADNHISQMIIQAILHNKSLAVLVSDINISQGNANWGKIKELMAQNYKIVFLSATMNSDLIEYLGDYYDN